MVGHQLLLVGGTSQLLSKWLMTNAFSLCHLAEAVIVRFLCYKGSNPYSPYSTIWGEKVTTYSSHLKNTRYLCELLGSPPMGDLSILQYLFIYSNVFITVGIHRYLFFTLNYNPILL